MSIIGTGRQLAGYATGILGAELLEFFSRASALVTDLGQFLSMWVRSPHVIIKHPSFP